MPGVLCHTGASITALLRSFFVTERAAAREGFLQRRRPAATLLAVGALLVAVVVSRHPLAVLALATVPLVLAVASAVSLRRLLARSLPPAVAAAIVVSPQAVLAPGPALVDLGPLSVTGAGLAYVLTFALRIWTGVALLAVVVLTTPFADVVAALRRLRVPAVVVWMLTITYRYLFLLLSELHALLRARESRSVGGGRLREAWRDAGRLSGTFLVRAIERGEAVHRGMVARGGGRAPDPYGRPGRPTLADAGFVATGVAVAVAAGVVRWLL
jgi:cobalt/nickel transport system permease protein